MIEYIYILAALAAILGAIKLLIEWLGEKEIQLFLCNEHGLPRPAIYVEGAFGTKSPNDNGRVFVTSKHIGTVIRVYDRSNGKLLIRQKLIRTGKDPTITIIIPDSV